MATKIPKKVFQVIVLSLLIPTFWFMIYDCSRENGVFAYIRYAVGHGSVGMLLAFIITLFTYFIPWVAVALLLRRFSAMPSLSQELSELEGGSVFEKMHIAYKREDRKLKEWKREGHAEYAKRMALGGFFVFVTSFIIIVVLVFLFNWSPLLTIAQYKIGLALVLAPVISLVLTIYYSVKFFAQK
ncbi:MAG TPA: hypothetical protein PKX12_03200 [Spirochaetota bacterium]|nr:hypothetical protein [Spirochaetota bacterium]